LLFSPLPKENVQREKGLRGSDPAKAQAILSIPDCSCGSPREFECQLMPSLLHLLDVDKRSMNNAVGKIDELMTTGGMNWGTIAIYTCKANCDNGEDFLIVQDSVDGSPKKRTGATEDSMVTNDDNDDEMVDNYSSDDDDDGDLDDYCDDDH
jgi:hypothetical protein